MRDGGLRAILNVATSMRHPAGGGIVVVRVVLRAYCESCRAWFEDGMRPKHYRGRACQNKRKEFHLLALTLLLAFKVKSGRTAQRAYA